MSDLSSRALKLAADISERMSNLSSMSNQIAAELQSVLTTHQFVFENLRHTERGVALAMGAYLDTVCRNAIGLWTQQNQHIHKDAFGERGLLGGLADKIQFMFLIGFHSIEFYNDLMILARVRNRFAHDSEINSFNHERVKGLIENLKVFDLKLRAQDGTVTTMRENLPLFGVKIENLNDRFVAAVLMHASVISAGTLIVQKDKGFTPTHPKNYWPTD